MEELIAAASKHYGIDITKRTARQQKILIAMYKYSQGWIDEDSLDSELETIFKENEHGR